MKLWLVLVAVACWGCSMRERPLQFNLGNEAVQLDWNRSIDSTSAVILDNIMEGLTTFKDTLEGSAAELLRPFPALAFSWSVSEGGKVYRFHLRSGVSWSDGVALDAQQFVDSWERLLNPATGSPNAYQLLEIENAAAFAQGKLEDFSSVGVKALDPLTLEVRLRRPVPYFPHLVASPSTFPIRKDLLEKHGEQWKDPENLVTLGPYRVAEWVQGERIVLRAFPSYHGARPKIGTVICRLITEPLTAYAFYENGELDILPRDLPYSYARQLQSHPDYRSGPKLALNYLLFNLKRAPFDKVENRRAFVRAMNREELASFFAGAHRAASGWIPPGLVGYSANLGLPGEGSAPAKFPSGSLVIRFSGSDTWNLVFQAMQRSMLEKLQVKSKLEPLEGRDFQKLLAQLAGPSRPRLETLPHLLLLGWVADYPDPHSFMNLFTSASENNYMRWKSPAYDQLVEAAVSTQDESVRKRYYAEAQKLLLEDEAVIMPLSISSHQALVRSNLRGVHLNVLDKWYFQNVEFSDDSWSGFGRKILLRIHKRGDAPGSS